ncbi:MAG TPA: GNAT family N-acetyltransferase [Gaiellaceae bacterium]|nr:GNAT family N-acetyltransferase [Gaiellaceae bacterium]
MIELRPAESDEDLEAWRSVRAAIMPNERTASVAELRAGAEWDTLWLLAHVDGELAGSGVSTGASTGGAFTQPRVLPAFRRRGVGTRLLHALADQALACGHEDAGAQLEEPGSAAFAARFGFTERNRQIEQVYTIRSDERQADVPEGITIAPLRGRVDLRARLYPELVEAALADLVVDRPIAITEKEWWSSWIPSDDWAFLALAGNELVGMAGLLDDEDRPERAENLLTAVRRDLRGRGIARALKQHTLRCAADRGLTEVYTWTQTGNEAMQQLNRSLGYIDRDLIVSVRAPLPLG